MIVGSLVGTSVYSTIGIAFGLHEGSEEGFWVGAVGSSDGSMVVVGLVDGRKLGFPVGFLDGSLVGLSVTNWRSVKVVLGTRLGSKV